jgi:ankyrin repeat protein
MEVRDRSKQTALMFAVNRGNLEIVQSMIDHGVDLNAQRHDGYTAMHFAAREGYADIAKALVAAGADTSIKDRRGRTPVDVAKRRGATNMVAIIDSSS